MHTLLLFGATGMVGSEVLHHALADARVDRVISIARRATGVTHPKLEEVAHAQFLDLAPVASTISRADSCIHCLGVYQNLVPEKEFWEITYGYIDALVTTLERVRPTQRLVLMGAQGADPTEKRPFRFAKAKGRAEKRITDSAVKDHFIFRPGYIKPGRTKSRAQAPEWLAQFVYKLVPSLGVDATDLARVMLEAALTGEGPRLIPNGAIRTAAAQLGARTA